MAAQTFERAGIAPSPDTTEPDVRALLTKIAADELDIGVVYVTDVVAADGEVDGIDIPDEVNVEARYPIVPISGSDAALDFVAFVTSPSGQAILAAQGFGRP